MAIYYVTQSHCLCFKHFIHAGQIYKKAIQCKVLQVVLPSKLCLKSVAKAIPLYLNDFMFQKGLKNVC